MSVRNSSLDESIWNPDGAPECPKCHGLGFISSGPHLRVVEVIPGPIVCECVERKHKVRMWSKAIAWMELPSTSAYEHMTFERFAPREAPHEMACFAVKAWAEGTYEHPFIVIIGAPGNGKTHLCIAAVQTAHSRQEFAKYAYSADLLADIRSRIGKDDPDAEGMLQRYYDVPLLTLDDIGVQSLTNWTLEVMDRLIDYRYRNDLKTIVTSNAPLDQLPMRIADRLMDKRKVSRFILTAPSYRSEEQW